MLDKHAIHSRPPRYVHHHTCHASNTQPTPTPLTRLQHIPTQPTPVALRNQLLRALQYTAPPSIHHPPHRGSHQQLAATDYAPAANDEGVLLKPLKEELAPVEVQNVFNYARNLRERYNIGPVIGAGSFGVVRECTEIVTGRKYACKTIPKAPKKGKCTPRYLLKLQSEVDAMVQLGTSLDAVYLKVCFVGVCICVYVYMCICTSPMMLVVINIAIETHTDTHTHTFSS